jgi:uncharacterized membrane protein
VNKLLATAKLLTFFVLLGIVTVSLVLREFFLVSTLSERGAFAFSVLVDAVLIWVGTVVAFAVWYWEIDGGGSDERTRDAHASEDFLFPQMDQQDGMRAIGWTPGFLDYLFVSFTTSTTFGPTDTPVLSGRVKIVTVIQAVLSLVVVIVLVVWAVVLKPRRCSRSFLSPPILAVRSPGARRQRPRCPFRCFGRQRSISKLPSSTRISWLLTGS